MIVNETLKPERICKNVFSLAVKISGLCFFCVGLKNLDAPAFMDITTMRCDNLNDIVSAVLPVIFNFAVAWWLLGTRVLAIRAYPEKVAIVNESKPASEKPPPPKPDGPQVLTGMEIAEEKLAVLVCKPKGYPSAK